MLKSRREPGRVCPTYAWRFGLRTRRTGREAVRLPHVRVEVWKYAGEWDHVAAILDGWSTADFAAEFLHLAHKGDIEI